MGFIADDEIEVANPEFLGVSYDLEGLVSRKDDDAAILRNELYRIRQLAGVCRGWVGQVMGLKILFILSDLAIGTHHEGMDRR